MLVHEWHPTALLRMVLLSFPQHPRLMVGSVPLRSVFNYFYSCGTVQKDNSKPHTHLRCPPVPFDRHSVAEKKNDYILATLSLPPHRHGRGQGVETSLVCRRVATKIIYIYLFLSPSQRRTPLSAIILCSLSHLPRCSRHT